MPKPEWVLTQDWNLTVEKTKEFKTLKAGSFVVPIDPYWLPAHIKNDSKHRFFDPSKEAYCYTAYGIVIIPKQFIRDVLNG